jgi:hypothetical protein
MAMSTGLTSDSIDGAAGFYDYRLAELELNRSTSHGSTTGEARGVQTTCNNSDCAEHTDAGSPILARDS